MGFLEHAGASLELIGAVRMLAAALLGSLIGIERSLAGKHAGMRTYALVALGSALFVIVGTLASYQLAAFPGLDPLRVAGSIVLGIGFIGTGLAFLRPTSLDSKEPSGELTTASGIWVAAGIGMACGFGMYILSILAALFSVVIFRLEMYVEHSLRERFEKIERI